MATDLHHLLVDVELVLRSVEQLLFNRADSDEPEDAHLVLLSDPVRSILRLQVLVRVPVAVEQDDCVGALQVEPQPTCARGQHKKVKGRVRGVELLNHAGPGLGARRAVKPQVANPAHQQVVLENGDHLRHLAKK